MDNEIDGGERLKELYGVFTKIKSISDAEQFLKDLCSIKELKQMAGRLHAAKLLMQGKTYLEVTEITSVSSVTLSRISRCLKNGKGYNKVLSND